MCPCAPCDSLGVQLHVPESTRERIKQYKSLPLEALLVVNTVEPSARIRENACDCERGTVLRLFSTRNCMFG